MLEPTFEDPRWANTGPLIYVEDLFNPLLSDADARHLLSSRRIRSGERVLLGDGAGSIAEYAITVDGGRRATISFSEQTTGIFSESPPSIRARVATFMPKADRLSFMVQKMSEAGVDDIYLLSDPIDRRGGESVGDGTFERLQRISVEASSQSKRAWRPTLHRQMQLEEFLSTFPDEVVLCDQRGTNPSTPSVIWLIGPEGGIDPSKIGLSSVRIASTVLRTETAAVVATALIVALREHIVTASNIIV